MGEPWPAGVSAVARRVRRADSWGGGLWRGPANLRDTRTRRDTAITPAGHGSPNFNAETFVGRAACAHSSASKTPRNDDYAARGHLPYEQAA